MGFPSLRGCKCFAALILISFASPAFVLAQTAHFSGARSTGATSSAGSSSYSADAKSNAVHADQAPASANFGPVNIGSISVPMTLTFTFDEAATLGSIAVVTQGAPNLDFDDAGTGSCTAGTAYGAGNTCTVDVTFTPRFAGVRKGAVVFYSAANNTGNQLASVPIYGLGTGPQIVFSPGAVVNIFSELGDGSLLVNSSTEDGAGDLFIADDNGNGVVEVPAGGHTWTEIYPSANGTQLIWPADMEVDGAGNLFIADQGAASVLEVPAGGGPAIAIEPVVGGTGLYEPAGLAMDAVGDLFIGDYGNNRVVEVPAGNGAPILIDPTVAGESLSTPGGVALDEAGDLFIGDYGNNRVVEVPAGGGAATAIDPTVDSLRLNMPNQVLVDGAGDLFIADHGNNRIVEIPAGGGAATAMQLAGQPQLNSMALDDAGDQFITASPGLDQSGLLEVLRSQPPTVNFPAGSEAGTTETVQVQNVGNAPLIFPVPGTGTNPSISANFTINSNGTTCPLVNAGDSQPGSLAVGQTCTLSFGFTPAGKGTAGVLQITDNNLNAPAPYYVTQTIPLMGPTGTAVTETAINVSSGLVPAGQPVTITATVIPEIGETAPTGTVTFAGLGQPAPVVSLNANAEATFSSSSVGVGTYAVSAIYSGDGNYMGSTSATVYFTVTADANSQVVAVSGKSFASRYGSGEQDTVCAKVMTSSGKALKKVAVDFSGEMLKFAHESALTAANGEACTGVTPLGAGELTVTASVKGAASRAAFSLSIARAPLTVGLSPSSASRAYGGENPDFKATVTGLVKGDAVNVDVEMGATRTSPPGKYSGKPLVSGAALKNYQVTLKDAVLTVVPAELTVTAASYESTYGQTPAPPTRYFLSGFVNGDTAKVVSGKPELSIDATSSTTVGTCHIFVRTGTLRAANYIFRPVGGYLYVLKAPLTAKASNQTMRQGQPVPKLTYTLTGFVNHDTAQTALTGAPNLSTSATSHSKPGSYAITLAPGSLDARNYRIVPAGGMLTVEPAE